MFHKDNGLYITYFRDIPDLVVDVLAEMPLEQFPLDKPLGDLVKKTVDNLLQCYQNMTNRQLLPVRIY